MTECHESLRSRPFARAEISVASFIAKLAGRSVYSIKELSDSVRPKGDVCPAHVRIVDLSSFYTRKGCESDR